MGFKSPRFAYTAMASAMMMAAGYANAGPGIFINDGDDTGCIVTSDESSRRNALFFLTNNNLEWAAGQASGGSMPSANAFRNKCTPGDAASQTNRALFYGDAGGVGSKHLSLGGRLDVNSGIIGLGDRAAGNNSIRIGSGLTLDAANSKTNSIAIGSGVVANANQALAIGSIAKATAEQTVALGNNAHAAGMDALAIGRSAHAQAQDSIAFGRSSQAAAKGVAIGSDASAAVANSVALGSGTTAVAAADQSGTKNVNGLNYTYAGNSANSSVTVGNRQIKQVGAGEVSAASTDAINGSQLYATQNVIGNIGKGVATNLGGGAVLKPDGTFTAPTYNLTDANGNAVAKNNVGDALNVLNSRLNTVGGGFQVAATTGTTQNVKPGNTLKFIDGTNTTTEVSTDGAGVTTVKINATGGGAAVPLTSNAATGQVNAPAAADANKAVTAGSVATAINTAVGKSGFNVEGGSVAGGTATGAATSRVNNNDTVKLQAGKNIALAQNGKEFAFGTVEDMEVTSIKAGTAGTNAKLDRDGLTITSSGNPVKLTNNGLNNGGHTIVGVAAGAVNATSTEAVNGSQLHKTANSTATHLGGGSAIQSDGSISAPTYSLTDSTGATVTKNNVGDALNVLNSRMNAVGTPVALNSNPSTGRVAAPTAADANKAATAGSVATAVNNAVSALESKGLQIDADSGTADTVALGETVKYAGDANIKTKVTDNQIGFSLADDLNVTSITTGDSKLDTNGLTITGGPSVTKTGINAGGKTITNVAAGTISATSTDAATGGQVYGALNNVKNVLGSNVSIDGSGNLSGNNIGGTGKTTFSDAIAAAYDKANSAAAGWKFQVNSAAEQTIEPTNTVKFLNGRNIELSNNGKDITVATKADLTADSLTINGNGPVINGSGISTNGKNINMGNSGKITNLTSGNVVAGDDSAVTGGAVNTAINTAVTDLKDAGFKIGADSGTDDTVKLGETVKYAGDANIKTTVTDNQIGFKLADSISVGPASGGNSVTVDGTAGTVTGLTNKTWNPASITSGRAATEDQLKAVANQVNSSATHYYSVNDGGGAHGDNFNNDGATGLNALAAGVGASAQDNDAVAIGSGTIAQGNGSIAIGAAAEVSGATGAGGIAIGASATAKNGGTAVGSGADTGNGTALIPGLPNRLNNNLALGDSARVKNDTNFNVALGSLSTAGDADLTAAAYKPNATSVIAGDINEAGAKYGEVSLGGDTSGFMAGSKMYRRLTNLAAGSADTDAVNVSQLKAVQAALQDQAPVAYTKVDGTKVYKHTDGNFYDAPNGAGNQVAAADVITSLQNAAGSTTAPTTLANVKDNLADTAAAVTNPTGNDRTTLSANKGHNAATVNDVLNAGFTVQGNGVDKDFVTHGDTVNFVNGQGTVANVSSTGGVTTVKFDTPMTYVDAAGTPATTPSNKVNLVGTGGPVTLGNVAPGTLSATSTDAVNGSQLHKTANSTATHLGGGSAVQADGSISAPTYTLTNASGTPTNYSNVGDALTALNARTNAANAGWKFQVNSAAEQTIEPTNTVKFLNGRNIELSNNGKDITVATKADLTADSLTINGNGPVINGNGINTNGKNIDMQGSASTGGKITNLTSGDIATGDNSAVTGDKVNTAINNLKDAGFKIGADSGTDDTVKLGETVKYAGDANIKTTVTDNQIGFKLADSITVGPASGGNPVTVDGTAGTVTGLTNKTWNPAGITSGRAATEDQLKAAVATTSLTVGDGTGGNPAGKVIAPIPADANKLVTAGDIANAINNSGFNITAGGNTVGTPAATTAKPGSTLTLAAGNGLTVQQNVDGNGNQTYTYAVDAQSVVQSAQAPVAYTKADGTKVYKHTDGNFYDAPNGAGNQVAAADVITSLQNAAGSTTAPTTLANVKDNLADTAAAVTNPTGNDRTTLSANKGHNAATVNDVLNAGFTVQGNGVDKDFVTHGDTVNFVNGQGTVANVSSTGGVTTVKFDTPMTYVDAAGTPATTPSNKVNLVGTGGPVTLGNVAAGAVNATSTDAVNGGQLHNSLDSMKNILGGNATNVSGSLSMSNIGGTGKGTIHDAIAEVNNKAATANAGWKFQVNNGAAETIRPNDTVGFKDGTNIAITNNGKDITIATKPDLAADSLTINGNGPVINGNGISTNGKNIDMGNSGKITNLADGSIAAGSKDAITGGQLHTALNNISNAATNLIGTTQPDIVTYDVSGNKADNTNNVKQAIDKMNNGGIKFFHVNDGTGTQTTAGTQPATEDSSASGSYGAAIGYQAKASGESGVAIGKGAQATAKNTISIGTGNIVSGEGSGAIGDPTIITGSGTYTVGNNNGTVSANAAGAFGNDNTLTGHNSRIIGNHNIVTTENTFVVGNNVSRATANSVVLGSNSSAERVHTTATTPGGNYTFGGLNDANVAGVNNVVGVVSVGQGAAGSDASVETRQIQNVAAGVVSATSTDAINGSQLYYTNQAMLAGVNGGLANLDARIGQVEGVANAGVAQAIATAGLPQAYLPGKNMVAVSGGYYQGQSGYAIGFSTISDSGNWIIKATGSGNSRSKFGGSIGAGYQW
ncbi:YadA-like family protein [Eikenella corrodens]|uniref:YadA-like family protein n=1 Tax=Eikenella corrodens TaxID=539 RepID=UPI001F494AB7|nr:YadA-like family protein [Eikenella corrodens]